MKKQILLSLCIFFQSLSSINIIFDVDGVLVKPCICKKIYEFIKVHEADIARDIYKDPSAVTLPSSDLENLCKFNPVQAIFQSYPDLISDFYLGNKTRVEIFRFLEEKKETLIQRITEKSNDFFNPIKRAALDLAIRFLFLDSCHLYGEEIRFDDTIERNSQGAWILKHVRDAEHRVFILSVMSEEWFNIYKLKFPDIFNLFTTRNIFLSSQCQCLMSKALFETFCGVQQLHPMGCVFISCSEMAIKIAREFGMAGILFKPGCGQAVIKELKLKGILNSDLSYFMPVSFNQPIPVIHPEQTPR